MQFEIMSVDDMAEDKSRWPMLAEMIRSLQVPDTRCGLLFREHPEFASWLSGDE